MTIRAVVSSIGARAARRRLLTPPISGPSTTNLHVSTSVQGKIAAAATGKVPILAQAEAQGLARAQGSFAGALFGKALSAGHLLGTATVKLALSSRGESENAARNSPTGVVGLSGRGESISVSRTSILAAIQILARSFSRANMVLTATLKATLNLHSSIVGEARGSATGVVPLLSRALSAVFGKSQPSGVVPIIARGEAMTTQRGVFLNTVQLLSRGLSRSTATMASGVYKLALAAKGYAVAMPLPSTSWSLSGQTLHYTFDDGTATDSSGNGYNGTLNNSPTPIVGEIGGALQFDGSTTYITVPQAAFNYSSSWVGSFSIWFNTTFNGQILGQASAGVTPGGSAPSGYVPALYIDIIGKLRASFFQNGAFTSEIVSANSYNDGKWHHAVDTYDGTTEKLYIDGVLVGSATVTETGYNSNNYVYWIGVAYVNNWSWIQGPGSVWQYWSGGLDDVQVYNRALSAAEVAEIYNYGKVHNTLIGVAAMFARSAAASFARSPLIAAILISARSFAESAARMAATTLAAALNLRSIAESNARGSATGKVPLNSIALSKASATSQPSGKVGLLAKAIADSFARASQSLALALWAKALSVNAARSSGTFKLAMAARSIAEALSKTTLNVPGVVVLVARTAVVAVARSTAKVALALNAQTYASVHGLAGPTGKLGLLARSISAAAIRATVNTQQVLALLVRSLSKAAATVSGGKFAAAITAQGASVSKASSTPSGKTILAALARAAGIGSSSLVGAVHLAARAASVGRDIAAPVGKAVLNTLGQAQSKMKAAASYSLAFSTQSIAKGAGGLAQYTGKLVLSARSAIAASSRNSATYLQNLVQFFARSAAYTFTTLGNRASALIGRPVTGSGGANNITGTGGSISVSGTAEDGVSGTGGANNVTGTGGSNPVSGEGP